MVEMMAMCAGVHKEKYSREKQPDIIAAVRIKQMAVAFLAFFLLALHAGAEHHRKPAKILLLTGGLYHDYDQLPHTLAANLEERLKNTHPVEFVITKDVAVLRKAELAKYDALVMNVCEQTPLTAEEKEGFLDAVRNGLPLVALHCTFWSFHEWPEFEKVLGAYVPTHALFGPLCLQGLHPDSKLMHGLKNSFELTDEPYFVNDRDPSVKVIVETCEPIKDRQGLEPEVWTKKYGKGRIFAMTFGHDAKAQSDESYLTLLTNGLLWAMGH